MSIKHVNIHGQPWHPGGLQQPSLPPKPRKLRETDEHHGWRVLGFSPEQLSETRKVYERTRAAIIERNAAVQQLGEDGRTSAHKREPVPPEWDQERYLRETRGKRIERVFSCQESAEQCAEMARRAGFLGVKVEPIIKKAQQVKKS